MIVAAPTKATTQGLQTVLKENSKDIEKPSRRKVAVVIDTLFASGADGVPAFLKRWRDKEVWLRKEDGVFFFGPDARGDIELTDIDTGQTVGSASSRDLKQVKPNSGVRAVIGAALVRFQLSDSDPTVRATALDTLERDADATQLQPLRSSIETETDPDLKARKERLERLLTISFGETAPERIEAIRYFEDDLGIDVRAALNPLLATTRAVAADLPSDTNIARTLRVGDDIERHAAHVQLAEAGLAPAPIEVSDRNAALAENASDGQVAGIALSWRLIFFSKATCRVSARWLLMCASVPG